MGRMFKDTNSSTIERIKASVNPPPKPKAKVKTVRTGDPRIDSVNNPGRTFRQLQKEMRPMKKRKK